VKEKKKKKTKKLAVSRLQVQSDDGKNDDTAIESQEDPQDETVEEQEQAEC